MADKSQNGNSPVPGQPLRQITLTFHAEVDRMDIDIKAPSMDCALDMLARATRHVEAQFRANKAIELQQQMRRSMEDAAIADQIRRTV